ncbi:MAG: hypothetical protein PUE12_00285 [Oscillospiraceae bacterium]|nr:hypothetical protein [Oscillospiraceae bacterium]
MSLSDIEKAAATTGPMPDELNGAEQLLFLSLRHLYATYHSGKISKEIAKVEKTQIYKEYEQNALNLKCWMRGLEKDRKLQHMTQEIKACDCKICVKYLRILEGIE